MISPISGCFQLGYQPFVGNYLISSYNTKKAKLYTPILPLIYMKCKAKDTYSLSLIILGYGYCMWEKLRRSQNWNWRRRSMIDLSTVDKKEPAASQTRKTKLWHNIHIHVMFPSTLQLVLSHTSICLIRFNVIHDHTYSISYINLV